MYKLSKSILLPSHIEGIIFDMDGTLVDSMDIHFDAYQYALQPWGIKYNKRKFLQRAGIPAPDTFILIAQDHGLKDFDHDMAMERKNTYLWDHLHEIKLIEPIADIMRKYTGKMVMSIGTGSNRKTTDLITSRLGINRHIRHLVSAADITNPKPDPETFFKCAELMGKPPEKCIVFEDAATGIKAAKAAGMAVIDVKKYLIKE